MLLLEVTRFLVKFIEILEKTNNKLYRTLCGNSANYILKQRSHEREYDVLSRGASFEEFNPSTSLCSSCLLAFPNSCLPQLHKLNTFQSSYLLAYPKSCLPQLHKPTTFQFWPLPILPLFILQIQCFSLINKFVNFYLLLLFLSTLFLILSLKTE